jgi:hypothetical protein
MIHPCSAMQNMLAARRAEEVQLRIHPSIVVWLLTFVIPLVTLTPRIARSFRRRGEPAKSETKTDQWLEAIRLLAGIALAFSMWRALRMISPDPGMLRASTAFAASIYATIYVSEVLDQSRRRDATVWIAKAWMSTIVFGTVCLGALGAVHWLRSMPRSAERPIHLTYPVQGKWLVVAGGRNAWLNHHHHGNPNAQNQAIDLISADPASPTEGRLVYAPLASLYAHAMGRKSHWRICRQIRSR